MFTKSISLSHVMALLANEGHSSEFLTKTVNDIPFMLSGAEDYRDMVLQECIENPWYFFREIIGLDSLSSDDIVHLALMLNGYDTVRLTDEKITDTVLSYYVHYVLKYTDIDWNIGLVSNDQDNYKQPIKAFAKLREKDTNNHINMLQCPGYITNEYTSRCCRLGELKWLLVNAKYSTMVADIRGMNTRALAENIKTMSAVVTTSDSRSKYAGKLHMVYDNTDMSTTDPLGIMLSMCYDNIISDYSDILSLLNKPSDNRTVVIL